MKVSFLAIFVISAIFASRSAFAVAPWGDQSLPVKDGVLVWLDATRQVDAWKAHQRELVADDPLDVFYDASGHARDFSQPGRDAVPRFIASQGQSAIRFDGKTTHLRSAIGKSELASFTAFIVASPRSNEGMFRAFLAGNETGKNDYQSGFTIDLGPLPTPAYGSPEFLNVEGNGFAGAKSLIKEPLAFDQFQVLTITCAAGENAIAARVNGAPRDRRTRAAGVLRADQLVLGARCFSNEAAPPYVQGFFDGDIAEVLLFDRVLSDTECAGIEAYLQKKHAGATIALGHDKIGGKILKAIENPPPLQMFVPGFSVRKLPLDLTNINNVRSREDGKLVALAYDGNIYLLSDTDGDGLEDKAELWWESKGRNISPIGMALTPPNYPHGRGLFVANKGKLSLIIDTDGDDKLDKEIVVAEGWPGTFHQVDTLGVAIAADNTVYFGVGCANFADGYQINKATGKSEYNLKGERGTIIKVSPDLKHHEVVCTGIRFPVGMAFNAAGDLFCTDQEGATWLPNGNPLDELLHIQPGRHYGFPPRHPTYLPNVIDEPSTFDYAPQHQSTCGLTFNEPVNSGPIFGPAQWRSDALVCGESRGKIYRTTLAKSAAGYVAKNQFFASLPMLTIDSCVSPAGDLVVTCHSGPPDWGTGPTGKGTLYKIRYADRDAPQPLAAWPASASEVRVAFDHPLDASLLKDLAKRITIDFGPYVGAGDEFEVMRPGYAAVRRQLRAPRQELAVSGVQITPDQRTLIVRTAPQSLAVPHSMSIAAFGHRPTAPGTLPQVDRIDLGYAECGLAAAWRSNDGSKTTSTILPHPDLSVARAFTAGSSEHAAFWPMLKSAGKLTLRTSLDLHHMLHPRVQPGSSLDYTPTPETITVTFDSNVPIELRGPGVTDNKITATPKDDELIPIEITLPTGATEPTLTASFITTEDARPRPLQVNRFVLPWARLASTNNEEQITNNNLPQLKGGDWLRGRAIFFGANAACSKCHTTNGVGSDLAPDLSNLIHRDYDSVLRDIREPSATLNPDHIATTVTLKNGQVYQGIMRPIDKERFYLRGDAQFDHAPVAMKDVKKIAPSPISLMPTGILEGLGEEKSRDLLTFLLTEPLQSAPIERKEPPTPAARTRAEIATVLRSTCIAPGMPRAKLPTTNAATTSKSPLRIVLVAGPKDHGPSEHDYPLWQQRWSTLLALDDSVSVDRANPWPSKDQWQSADVVVFYSANPGFNLDSAKDLDAHLARGKGLVYLHFGVNGNGQPDALAQRIGLSWGRGPTFRHGHVDLQLPDLAHPITRGLPSTIAFEDETYWQLTGDPSKVHVLGTSSEQGQPRPILWTFEKDRGRVFVSILGHFTWTFDDPLFRLLILRGIAWSAGSDANRLDHLATIGARVR